MRAFDAQPEGRLNHGGGSVAVATRHAANQRIARGEGVPKLKPSTIAIVGPLVCEGMPEPGLCRWVEGGGRAARWCGRPGARGGGAYHRARVYPPAIQTAEMPGTRSGAKGGGRFRLMGWRDLEGDQRRARTEVL